MVPEGDLHKTRTFHLKAAVNLASQSHGNQWKWLSATLIVADGCMIFLSMNLSYAVRFYSSLPIFQLDVVPSRTTYSVLVFALIPLFLAVFAAAGLYNRRNLFSAAREASLLLTACTIVLFLVMASDFLASGWFISRGWLLIDWLIIYIMVLIERFLIRRYVRRLRKSGKFLSPALIVGANAEGRLLVEQFSNRKYSGLEIVGFVDDTLPPGTPVFQQLKTLGPITDIDRLIQDHRVEELIVASSAINQPQLIEIFQQFGLSKHVNLRMSSGLYQIIATGFEVAEIANVPLIGIQRIRLTGINSAMKLLLDYSLTIPGLILISPFLAILALLIKLDSPGPIIYRRRVMGMDGRQFDAFKFRTMVVNADRLLAEDPDLRKEFEKDHKLKRDPRITRLGKFLRKTSLDELPQLFNVLRNEMSLVGPRMISPDEMQKYQEAGINLLTVKPGITGAWQVNGRSNVSYEDRVRMDMYYIRNWSLMLDLYLLWRTIPAVLSQQGAY